MNSKRLGAITKGIGDVERDEPNIEEAFEG